MLLFGSVVCFVALVSNNGNNCKLADELYSHFLCLFSNESFDQELLSVCCLAVLVCLIPKKTHRLDSVASRTSELMDEMMHPRCRIRYIIYQFYIHIYHMHIYMY